MIEAEGDLFAEIGSAIIAFTTHGTVNKRGATPMLHGSAREALRRFPELAEELGGMISKYGNHVHPLSHGLVSFPVEHGWMEVPDPRLIERSAGELKALADQNGWKKIIVPRPGCGGGGLKWEEVKPLLEPYFDERFTLVVKAR
ncbi:MAG: ADP-ribose-binding protein [Deltaproteobacteria bacterium]|nr:MAG: ADP-ribose-binding protein [Deltaproteobacteria bacterium]